MVKNLNTSLLQYIKRLILAYSKDAMLTEKKIWAHVFIKADIDQKRIYAYKEV